jgi:hypothetical protein
MRIEPEVIGNFIISFDNNSHTVAKYVLFF